MSDCSLQWIIGRASTNFAYRRLLLSDFSQAVAGYNLTDSETAQVKQWSSSKSEAVIELDDLLRYFGEELPQLSAGKREEALEISIYENDPGFLAMIEDQSVETCTQILDCIAALRTTLNLFRDCIRHFGYSNENRLFQGLVDETMMLDDDTWIKNTFRSFEQFLRSPFYSDEEKSRALVSSRMGQPLFILMLKARVPSFVKRYLPCDFTIAGRNDAVGRFLKLGTVLPMYGYMYFDSKLLDQYGHPVGVNLL